MGDAYKAAGQAMARKAKRSFGVNFHPMLTLIFLCATITFMVLGWFAFENVMKGCIALACALVAILGLFGSRFHQAFEKVFDRTLKGYNKKVGFFTAIRYYLSRW